MHLLKILIAETIFFVKRAFNKIGIPATSMEGLEFSANLERAVSGKSVLEFGGGGSSLEILKACKRLTTVESDRRFATKLEEVIGIREASSAKFNLYWADIGPTRSYGQPLFGTLFCKRHKPMNYFMNVFVKYPELKDAQVVFVDGRFRVACALSSILNIKAPFLLIFDDYINRKEYHEIEELIGSPNDAWGKTALFHINVSMYNADQIIETLFRYQFDYR